MRISLVVAMADNGVIGRAGGLPWHLPDDLKHFRALTLGKSVLMGRRTFESIGRPLPGRQSLVMSHALSVAPAPEVHLVATLAQACACADAWAGDQAELCVIGGAQIYALALPYADRIHLTQVHAAIAGDVFFPGFPAPGAAGESMAGWRESARVGHPPDARHAHAMSFVTLDRIQPPLTL
jgi:dihydrofolate reductase